MPSCLTCINILAIIFGGVLGAFGIWLLDAGTSLVETLSSLDSSLGSGISMEWLARVADRRGVLRIAAICITISGCVAVVIALLGIVAEVRHITLLAFVYKVAVFLVLSGHIIATVYLLVKKSDLHSDVRKTMLRNQNRYFVARTKFFKRVPKLYQEYTHLYEHMHISYQCCGVSRTDDIRRSRSFRRSKSRDPDYDYIVPASCCRVKSKSDAFDGKFKLTDPDCPKTMNSSTMHKEPCLIPVSRLMDGILLPILLASGVFAILLASALGLMAAKVCSGFDSDSDSSSSSSSESDSD